MIDTYISSKGEKTLIKEMAGPHLIHTIAKLSRKIGFEQYPDDVVDANTEMLKALKTEAISRLTPKKEEGE